jgi:DNA modification methylase
MMGEKAELCFTSPPYSDMREYKSDGAADINKLKRFIPAIKPHSEYCLVNLGIQIKNYEIVQYWDEYIREAKDAGYLFLSWSIWDKMNAGGISNQSAMFAIEHEWIFVFGNKYKDINRTVNKSPETENRRKYDRTDTSGRPIRGVRLPDGTFKDSSRGINYTHKQLPTVVQVSPYLARNDDNLKSHPAVMSVGLPTVYINAMTDPGQYVIDPFLGSGTTMIACENTGRKCRGIEIAPDYVAVCLQRYQDATGKEPVRING